MEKCEINCITWPGCAGGPDFLDCQGGDANPVAHAVAPDIWPDCLRLSRNRGSVLDTADEYDRFHANPRPVWTVSRCQHLHRHTCLRNPRFYSQPRIRRISLDRHRSAGGDYGSSGGGLSNRLVTLG